MRLLIFGGSVFLSKAVAKTALERGHHVACVSRGDSGSVPKGAQHIILDRSEETNPRAGTWTGLASREWDAVIDVARTPSWVETALTALAERVAHWTFVSSISAYANLSAPAGTPDTTPLLEPAVGDLDDTTGPEAYGRNKVACEQSVQRTMAGRDLIVRPGLIVGPGDPSGRYTYWPMRLARGGRVLVPEPQDAPSQVIDVRDLAEWLVSAAEQQLTGVFDATGPSMRFQDLLRETAEGVDGAESGAHAKRRPHRLVWIDPETLLAYDVRPWAGPRSLPLWIPGEEYAGMCDRDVAATLAAGLAPRPLADTARDTLQWVAARSSARRSGLTWDEEQDVLSSLKD